MTRTTNQSRAKLTLIFNLIIICLLCFTLFFVSACSENENAEKEQTYTYTETDDGIIKNASFVYGTVGTEYKNFPKTSLTGWTLTKSSSAKSGVVNTSDAAWTELMNTLYSDSGILNYLKEVEDFTNDTVISKIKEQNGTDTTPTSDEIKKYIVDNYFLKNGSKFANPGVHAGALDDKIYMLNNYTSNWIGDGSIQKLASASEVTLNKGEYAKISVWVYATNISDSYVNETLGANIRITNTFNGTAQEEYGIFNITNTDGWKNYTFYVKADDVYTTKFTLVLGLGYDEKNAEGTVYFDDIEIKHLTATEFATEVGTKSAQIDKLEYNNKDANTIKVESSVYNSETNYYLYDMSLNIRDISGYASLIPINAISYGYTTANNGERGDKFGTASESFTTVSDAPYGDVNGNNDAIKIELDKASYTIKLDGNLTLNSENYSYITFFIKSELSAFYSKNITVDVWDVPEIGNAVKRAAVASLTDLNDEWTQVSVVIKNNFDKDASPAYNAKSYYVELIIGTTDVKSNAVGDYAKGTVYVTQPLIATGFTVQYENDANEEAEIETANYQYYKLFSGSATGSTALYAGYPKDYVADEDDNETYSLTVAPSEMGTILNAPAQPKGYKGINANHFYINPELEETGENYYSVNTNKNAGLINTRYLANYTNSANIKTALNFVDGSDNIQPLMIYNENTDSYGYIGTNNTIAASAYAKVSVKVKVFGDNAFAYVYVVDTSDVNKTIMTFEDFTVNFNNNYSADKNTEIKGSDLKLQLKVTPSMMEDDGWVTVEFYVATGATAKNFRVEVWNGSRDGAEKSQGYVFFNNITVSTSSAFSEPTNWATTDGSPLYNVEFAKENLLMYQRQLTNLEKEFNDDVASDKVEGTAVSYNANYVWAKTNKLIYAVYNTIDPVEIDPYESIADDDDSTDETEPETDPSTFWLSLSSILLGVALVLAIVMLFIKNIRRRRKANASDAKSHYTITSRTKKKSAKPAIKEEKTEEVEETTKAQETENIVEETSEEQPTPEEKSLDEYVYGDVQNFGEEDDK